MLLVGIMKKYLSLSVYSLIFVLFSFFLHGFGSEEDFDKWLVDYEKELVLKYRKLDRSFVSDVFKDIKFKESIINLDRNQSEFKLTADQYLKNLINKYRVTKGRLNLIKYERVLDEVENKYKVPKELMISFWGMETSYGRITGRVNPVGSFLNLIYEGRRKEFFEKELVALLELMEDGHIDAKTVKSSWAGALGNPQFMPSNYLAYGVSADGDKKIDLWDSYPDTFHSMGNFIKTLGWQYGETWGTQVVLSKKIPDDKIGLETREKISYWEENGVKPKYYRKDGFVNASEKASLIKIEKENNKEDVYFLVYDNFLVIRKWNRSTLYALAVGILNDEFLKKKTYSGYK